MTLMEEPEQSPAWQAVLDLKWVTEWDSCLCDPGSVGEATPCTQPEIRKGGGNTYRPLVYLGPLAGTHFTGNSVFTSSGFNGHEPASFCLGGWRDCQLFREPRHLQFGDVQASYVIDGLPHELEAPQVSTSDVYLFANLMPPALERIVDYLTRGVAIDEDGSLDSSGASATLARGIPTAVAQALIRGTMSEEVAYWMGEQAGCHPAHMDSFVVAGQMVMATRFSRLFAQSVVNRPYLVANILSTCGRLFSRLARNPLRFQEQLTGADMFVSELHTAELPSLRMRAQDPALYLRDFKLRVRILPGESAIRKQQEAARDSLNRDIDQVDEILEATKAPPALALVLLECFCKGLLDDSLDSGS
jgi:hypothetical protein